MALGLSMAGTAQAEGFRISTNKTAALKFDQFTIGTKTYSNVVVSSRTASDVFIRHQNGLANFKVDELSAEQLVQLGYNAEGRSATTAGTKSPASSTAGSTASAGSGAQDVNARTLEGEGSDRNAKLMALGAQIRAKFGGLHPGLAPKGQAATEDGKQGAPPSLNLADVLQTLPKSATVFLSAFLVALPILYFFFCYTAKLICTKAGSEPGFLIWVPILSAIELMRAAKLPGWIFLLMYVPVVNLVLSVVWCFRIANARGKNALTALALIFPITSPFAWLYLAYSK